MTRVSSDSKQVYAIAAGLGFGVCLILLGLGWPTPPASPPPVVDTISIRDLYPQALETAKAWKEDAYFTGAQASFWPRDSDEFQRAFFSFRSPSTDVVGLLVTYDPATDSFTDKWLSVFKEHPHYKVEIRDADWHLDSVEALEVAQSAGGADFVARQLHRDFRTLYVRLEKRQAGQDLRTVWFAAYYVGMPPTTTDLRIVIDAVTGEVLEIDGTTR